MWLHSTASPAAALPPPTLQSFGLEAGLPSSQIHALTQDREGVLWIGTSAGLARYDGRSISVDLPHPDRDGALPSASVETLHADALGRVWIGSSNGFLSVREPGQERLRSFPLRERVAAGESLEIWSLTGSPRGVYVGTVGAGIVEVDASGTVLAQYGLAQGLPDADIWQVLSADAGRLWVAFDDAPPGLYDPLQQRFTPMPWNEQSPAAARHMALDGGSLWLLLRDARLCQWRAATGLSCRTSEGWQDPGRLLALAVRGEQQFLLGHGELQYRDADASAHWLHRAGSMGSVPRAQLWTALFDREGGLWMGSLGGGLVYLSPLWRRVQLWQPDATASSGWRDGRVRGVARDQHGRVWIGSMDQGLHWLDLARGVVHSLPAAEQPARRIWVIQRRGDQLWLGHNAGVTRYTLSADGLSARRDWLREDLVGGHVDLLALAPEGVVWAASMGAGLSRINPDGSVRRYAFAERGLLGLNVQQLGLADGSLLVATDAGLFRHQADCDCFAAVFAGSRSVEAFVEAEPGQWYVYADAQLERFRGGAMWQRDPEFAAQAMGRWATVGGMAWDGSQLWLAGPQGLARFDPGSARTTVLGRAQGLLSREFSDRPFHVAEDGRFWLASEQGVLSIQPAEFASPPAPAPLQWAAASIRRGEASLTLQADVPLRLAADDRDLSVAVRLASLLDPGQHRFEFDLQPWDLAPASVGADGERRFGTLPPGDYQLQVRAFDAHGQPAANTLEWQITVAAPWWRQSWALALWAALLLALGAWWRRRARLMAEAEMRWREGQRQAAWAEQVAAEKSQMLAELSHEIRNPLNGLLGLAALLAKSPLDAVQRERLRLLQDAGRRLAQLMEEVLDWTRLVAGRLNLDLAPVDLAPVLGAVHEQHAALAAQKGLRLELDAVAGLVVQAHPGRLRQVLDNLLGNAIKYTQQGSVAVQLRGDGRRVEIAIRDSGPGIAPDDRERLFEPFQRGAGESRAPGIGLGLAISRGLARRMGGELWLDTTVTEGCRFVLELAASPAAPASVTATPSEATPAQVDLGGVVALVVEDDPVSRELAVLALREMGCEVLAAGDGLAAMVEYSTRQPRIAVLDWDLPQLDGLSLARILRAQPDGDQLVLIAATGRVSPADRAQAIEAGFDAHLGKPYEAAALQACVAQVLAARARGDG